MLRYRTVIRLLLILAPAGGVAHAATIAPPANLGELARLSAAVVLAEALETPGVEPAAVRSALPHTLTRFRRIELLGGARVGEHFEVVEPGGIVDSGVAVVGGAPRYEAGRTYVLFLHLGDDGYWRSRMLAYGLLVEDPATGLLEPLPEAGWIEPLSDAPFEAVEAYRKDALLRHLREVLAGEPWNRETAGAVPALAFQADQALGVQFPPGCSFLTGPSDNIPLRWFDWETGAASPAVIRPTTPGQTGMLDGGTTAVQLGVKKWEEHTGSLILYEELPSIPASVSCSGAFDTQPGAVLFNDPCDDIAPLNGCTGTLAFGGAFGEIFTADYDQITWRPAIPDSSFVVVNDGTECIGNVSFQEMMTHELGHTLGFGHHDAAPPPDPTMSATLKADGRGAELVGRDRTCASFAYHSFLDVPFSHLFWSFIEALNLNGVTSGCAAGLFCPGDTTTRGQMARFLLSAANAGAPHTPPPCTGAGPFSDVPCSHPFADWIQELVALGVTSGCGGGAYCPGAPVTRAQMAAFLLRAFHGPGFTPPPCVTDPFGDVSAGSTFCPWIQELVNSSITAGCGGGNYCPGAPVTRGQMAKFLTSTFALIQPD